MLSVYVLSTILNEVSLSENVLNFRHNILLKVITIILVNLILLFTQSTDNSNNNNKPQ